MMSRRRKNREQTPVTPVQAPEEAPGTPVSADELQALRERLAEVERKARPEDPSPVAARQRERARQEASFYRADGDTPCPACGLLGGPQRQFHGELFPRTPAWVCGPCAQAMAPGIGTNSFRTFNDSVTRDRLACLAAGMERFTPSFRVLAARYGLKFTLAMDSGGGDGTAWSHLGQLDLWREVGTLAIRREDAGFGVLPATPASVLSPDMVDGFVPDPTHPRGRRHAMVPTPVEPPSAQQVAAQLVAEEAAIEAELTAQRRREVERTEEAARKAERDRINAEYRAAVRAQEALFAAHRRKLREARAMVLKSADTRADFDAIVSVSGL